jgi:hypothetical protein
VRGTPVGGEDFDRCRSCYGKKTTAIKCPDDGRIAIFAAISTRPLARDHVVVARPLFAEYWSAGARGIGDMRQLGSLLRSTRSRIGRQLAVIVAIAAASLPSAGV